MRKLLASLFSRAQQPEPKDPWAQGYQLSVDSYTDSTGVELRAFAPTQVPHQRLHAAFTIWERYQYKLTRAMVIEWAEQVQAVCRQINTLAAPNIHTIHSLAQTGYGLTTEVLHRAQQFGADYEACLEIAAYLYVQADEQQSEIDSTIIRAKVKRWMLSEEDTTFFIAAALPLMESITADYSANSAAYFRGQIEAVNRLRTVSALQAARTGGTTTSKST
jgi:hypothetical protein